MAEEGKPTEGVERPEPPPTLKRFERPRDVTAICMVVLVVLALFWVLSRARDFFLPLALATILALILQPAVNALERLRIPRALGAMVVLGSVVCFVVMAVMMLTEPATQWIRETPQTLQRVEEKVRDLARPAVKVKKAAEEVEKLTEMTEETETPKVAVKSSGGLLGTVIHHTKGLVVMAVETFVLTYFLLAAGDLFLRKLITALPRLKDKKRAVEIANETQKQISGYLVALTMLNVFEGVLVAIGMWAIGMPNPLLWGVMAAFVNYIPYIGAMLGIITVTMVGFVTFDTLGRALSPALVYLSINFIDNFLAPYFMGKRLTLNPVMVFLALMFWGWLWGIIGVLLAVPLLMTIKVFCDHIPTLAAIGEFLAGEREPNAEPKPGGAPAVASA